MRTLSEVCVAAAEEGCGVLVQGVVAVAASVVPLGEIKWVMVCPTCRVMGGHDARCTDPDSEALKQMADEIRKVIAPNVQLHLVAL